MLELDNRNLVVKSNHLVEASYKLSTQEQRIILVMASMVKSQDEDFNRYRIKVKNFIDLIGIKDQSKYPDTKRITKKLLEKTLVIKSEKSELQIGWLSSAEYFDGQGVVELEFSPKLKPYLLQLKEFFTQYQLKNVVRLKRSYSIRIYELLKQYEQIQERTFEVEELKRILGVRPNEYKKYADLKRRVLIPSQKELKQRTDLQFSFKEKKQGRKVNSIIFFIRHNKPKSQAEDEEPEVLQIINQELYDRLHGYFCLSPDQAREVMSKYSEERILENLIYVESRHKKGLLENIGAYTFKAINEDYRLQMSLFDIEIKEKKKQEDQEEFQKWLLESLEIEFQKFMRAEVENVKKRMPESEFEVLYSEVRAEKEAQFGKGQLGIKLVIDAEVSDRLAKMTGMPSKEEWIEVELAKRKKTV